MARVNSSTLMPSRWHSFWAAVLSGIEAWSWFFSFMKDIFPNWSTAEITFNMAEGRHEKGCSRGYLQSESNMLSFFFLYLFHPLLHTDSSGVNPIMAMESIVWVKFSESLWPGTEMEPLVRKRYSSALPRSKSAKKDKTRTFKHKKHVIFKLNWHLLTSSHL